MKNRKIKSVIFGFILIFMLNGCEKAGLKIENNSENIVLVTAVYINGKNVLKTSKKLPPKSNRSSPEGHILEAKLSGKEHLSVEFSVDNILVTSTCQIPELIGEGTCYLVFAHFNGTKSLNCNYVCDDLSRGL